MQSVPLVSSVRSPSFADFAAGGFAEALLLAGSDEPAPSAPQRIASAPPADSGSPRGTRNSNFQPKAQASPSVSIPVNTPLPVPSALPFPMHSPTPQANSEQDGETQASSEDAIQPQAVLPAGAGTGRVTERFAVPTAVETIPGSSQAPLATGKPVVHESANAGLEKETTGSAAPASSPVAPMAPTESAAGLRPATPATAGPRIATPASQRALANAGPAPVREMAETAVSDGAKTDTVRHTVSVTPAVAKSLRNTVADASATAVQQSSSAVLRPEGASAAAAAGDSGLLPRPPQESSNLTVPLPGIGTSFLAWHSADSPTADPSPKSDAGNGPKINNWKSPIGSSRPKTGNEQATNATTAREVTFPLAAPAENPEWNQAAEMPAKASPPGQPPAGATENQVFVRETPNPAGEQNPPVTPPGELTFAARIQPEGPVGGGPTVSAAPGQHQPAALPTLAKPNTENEVAGTAPAQPPAAGWPSTAYGPASAGPVAAASPAAAAAAPAGASQLSAPAEPRIVEVPTKPAAGPLKDISLQVGDPAQKVEVRVMQQSGELRVAVRTGDSDLAHGLQQGLSDLVGRLQETGFRAEAWRPSASTLASGPVPEFRTSPGASSNGNSQSYPGGSQQQQGERRQNQSQRPEWVEELEDSIARSRQSQGTTYGHSN